MTKDSPFADKSGSYSVAEYDAYVKSRPCLINDKSCLGKGVDPHHLKTVGAGRKRILIKWEDYTKVPLCRGHHTEVGMSKEKFEEKYKINLFEEALIMLSKWIFNKSKKEMEFDIL